MITSTPSPPSGYGGVDLSMLEATIDARLERIARREHLHALVRMAAVACLPVTAVALATFVLT